VKCPACHQPLYKIHEGEYACHNPDCPERSGPTCPEWYGDTQKEINEMHQSSYCTERR
jgi:hypothetical protein